uniref:RGS domain-containing protein n=1 Tax=Paramormyrops kingsleyae TaxID=1676925 RepID=A0A3B3RNC4_9TELE
MLSPSPAGMKVGTSEVNLNSGERSVGCWAAGFERLLQDPQGIHYFSEFLKKEFSEENILFWQACESFSHLPENDKKQLSQKACEIYSSFLSSQATTPVNIDSRAQLADDVLNAPRPDMFHEPQLQIFNLMKFDSYTRFLRSSLYRDCMLAEVEDTFISTKIYNEILCGLVIPNDGQLFAVFSDPNRWCSLFNKGLKTSPIAN